jgi:hypothetical protein
VVGEQAGASSAYVGMTRGRDRSIAHPVTGPVENARQQWIDVFGRAEETSARSTPLPRAAAEVAPVRTESPVSRRLREPADQASRATSAGNALSNEMFSPANTR